MARKELSVKTRDVLGKKVAQLRRTGVLPGNVYGHNLASVAVQIDADELEQTLRHSTANEVIDLKIAGESEVRPVVVHHVQRHPLTSGILHLDFYQVSLREKMRADVPIVLTGTSEAVVTFNGVLLTGIEALHIEALPLDIPAHIEVDISPMTELETAIHVRDLIVPGNVTVLTDPDVVVAQVASPRVSVEGEEPAEGVEEAAEAEAAEGEEAPATTEESSEEAST
jgi:large subunit ribosomal protein L25